MAVIEFVRVVVVGSKLEVARDVPWRKGNYSRIRLSTTSKRLGHQDRPFVHKYLSAEIFNNPHNGTMKHNHLVINEKTVYQKFLIRFLQNVTPWKQASQEISHVTDCISDKVLHAERGFAEQLLNSISQRETLRASATRQLTSISVPLASHPLSPGNRMKIGQVCKHEADHSGP